MRRPVRLTNDAMPFAGMPTRVAYRAQGWSYIGEPSATAYRKFMKLVDRPGFGNASWAAVEFDRGGPIQISGRGIAQHRNPHLARIYHLVSNPYDIAGSFTRDAWSVRSVCGYRCYCLVARGTRVPAAEILERRRWLTERGLYESTRRDEAAL